MKAKVKRIIYISGGVIILAILAVAGKVFSDNYYRTRLPEYPDFKTISKPLTEQISAAGKKAYRNPTASNLGLLGMVYHSGAYYDKAALCYELAVNKNKKEWIWSYYLGYLNQELGESKNALENFRVVIEENPNNYLAWYYEGGAFQNLGQSENAEKVFDKIVRLNDQDISVLTTSRNNYFPLQTYAKFRLARIYLSTNRPDSAEKSLREILKKNITFGPAYRLLGNVYALKGDSALSKNYTIRANDMAPFTPPVDTLIDKLTLMSRSDLYLMKQIDVAVQSLNPNFTIKLINNALQYFPDNKFLISKTINLFLLMGKGKQALPYLEKHRYYYREDYHELVDVADLLFDNGYKSEAMEYFYLAKKLKSGETDIQGQLAIWLFNRGMNNDALNLMNEQLEKDPGNPDVLSNGVYLLLMLNEKEKAKQLLTRLKVLKPSDPITIKMTGVLAEKEGNLKEALVMYEKAFNADPENLSTIKYLGMTFLREEMWSKAILFFRKALEYHPNEPYLLEGLGSLLVTCPDSKLRNIPEGREFSERAFFRFTSPPLTQISAGINLSTACYELGDRQNATYYINKTIIQAVKANVQKEYLAYLENLSKKFSISN